MLSLAEAVIGQSETETASKTTGWFDADGAER
jgi:hypothetical protein